MNKLILCQPTGKCDDRNRCARYRIPRRNGAIIRDFWRAAQENKCFGFLTVYDCDVLMPDDWQERLISDEDGS